MEIHTHGSLAVIKRLLEELKKYCGGKREIRIAKELTKKFEEHIGQNIDDIIKFFENKEPKGEFTILVKGIEKITGMKQEEFLRL